MKISILQEKLKKGLNITERVSSKSLTLPILNNILLSTNKNFLNLSATDLEIGINWWALSKIEKEGKIAIPSRLLLSFINLLPNKQIDFQVKDNNLNVKCDSYETKIKGFSSEDFPLIPKVNKEEFVSLQASGFCRSLAQLVDIALPSTTRPEISGIYFKVQKDLLTIASTDSFRLGEKKIPLMSGKSINQEYSLIIPQKTIKEIINIFQEKEKDLKIYFSPNQIMFEYLMEEADHPEVQVVSRLIEGEYPNYKEIIPSHFTTQITLNKEDLVNQIKSASLFSGKVNEVKLKVNSKKNEIEISSQSIDVGDYKSSLTGKIEGDNLEVSFNHKYLLDGLSNIETTEVVLELNSDSGPGVVKPIKDDSYLYVVMPIKAS